MSSSIWKCFQCNLVFNDDENAYLHIKLTKHVPKKFGEIPDEQTDKKLQKISSTHYEY